MILTSTDITYLSSIYKPGTEFPLTRSDILCRLQFTIRKHISVSQHGVSQHLFAVFGYATPRFEPHEHYRACMLFGALHSWSRPASHRFHIFCLCGYATPRCLAAMGIPGTHISFNSFAFVFILPFGGLPSWAYMARV